jgi:hypothetical protein
MNIKPVNIDPSPASVNVIYLVFQEHQVKRTTSNTFAARSDLSTRGKEPSWRI